MGRFFSHRSHRFNRASLRTVSNSQKAFGIQISQNLIAKDGCWVMGVRCWWLANVGCKVLWYRLTWCLCEPLCVLFICVLLWEIERTHSMRWDTCDSLGSFSSHAGKVFSLTERTEFTELFGAQFEPTERLRHTEFTERYSQRWVLGDGCWVLMITHRGISVITLLPFGGGDGGGADGC